MYLFSGDRDTTRSQCLLPVGWPRARARCSLCPPAAPTAVLLVLWKRGDSPVRSWLATRPLLARPPRLRGVGCIFGKRDLSRQTNAIITHSTPLSKVVVAHQATLAQVTPLPTLHFDESFILGEIPTSAKPVSGRNGPTF